jgi:transketolase
MTSPTLEQRAAATPAERRAAVEAAAHRIRRHALFMGEVQGQGYVGQALGAADILATVYADQLRFRPEDPEWDGRDRFLLSTGHYAIGLYAALAEAGVIPVEELETYGSDGSRLPMSGMATYTPGMEISGGSLGHGLTIAVGLALGLRHRGNPARVINFLSDGELDEGSTWEAAMGAAHHRLGRLTAVVDINALQADGATEGVLRTEPVADKWAACGWQVFRVDGNDAGALLEAFDAAGSPSAVTDDGGGPGEGVGAPAVVLCDTKVGRGVPLLETREKAHFMRIEEHEWAVCNEQLEAGWGSRQGAARQEEKA